MRIRTESYRFGAEKFFTDSGMFSFTIDGFNYRFLQRCNVYCGGLWELPFMDRYGKGTSYDDLLILMSSARLIRNTSERYNTQGISIGLNMHLMRGQTMDPFLGVSSGIGACAFGRHSQGGCRAYLYGAHIGLRYHVTKEIFLQVQTEIHRVELRFVDCNRNDIYLLPSSLKQWMFGVGVTAFWAFKEESSMTNASIKRRETSTVPI